MRVNIQPKIQNTVSQVHCITDDVSQCTSIFQGVHPFANFVLVIHPPPQVNSCYVDPPSHRHPWRGAPTNCLKSSRLWPRCLTILSIFFFYQMWISFLPSDSPHSSPGPLIFSGNEIRFFSAAQGLKTKIKKKEREREEKKRSLVRMMRAHVQTLIT